MPVRMYSRSPSSPPLKKRQRGFDENRYLASQHPFGVKPGGNGLFAIDSIRGPSLGLFALISDELILHIFSLLEPEHWARLQLVSRVCRAFALHEAHWREAVVSETNGRLACWSGSWRQTLADHRKSMDDAPGGSAPSITIPAHGLYSDALYYPVRLATAPLDRYIPHRDPSRRQARSMDKVHGSAMNTEIFIEQYIATGRPCIIVEDLVTGHLPSWTMDDLNTIYAARRIRAEALTMTMSSYCSYSRDCQSAHAEGSHTRTSWIPDDSPFYLFDPTLARSLQQEGHWVVPRLLRAPESTDHGTMRADLDLFSLLKHRRPDNAWVIAGPSRSGSGWHVDPNNTSAWNTVLSGKKLWALLPPGTTPPGVYVSEDGSSITAPLSIIEWFLCFWDECVRLHGRRGDDTLIVEVCSAGETIFVPYGYRHLVINLEECVAFTQNFASMIELPAVLDMFKNAPHQLSGFRIGMGAGEDGESDPELDAFEDQGLRQKQALFRLFKANLSQSCPDLLRDGLERLREREEQRSLKSFSKRASNLSSRRRHEKQHIGGGSSSSSSSSLWNTLKAATNQQDTSGFAFDLNAFE